MEEIHFVERGTNTVKEESVPAKKMLNWLYAAPFGRLTLNALFKRKFVSSVGGWYMNSRMSRKKIAGFIEDYKIDMSQYQLQKAEDFKHFNDFFYRKINTDKRPIGDGIVSPADGKLLVFPTMKDVDTFFVKGIPFTLADFLKDQKLTERYTDGAMLIVRLAPTDYHRYHFPAKGVASAPHRIKGHYYSVSPLALRKSLQIFCENEREWTELETENAGNMLIVDVGATMVGTIIQTYASNSIVEKGDEKGYFAFGGSTIVVLFEKGRISFDQDLCDNSAKGMETEIKMGEQIARSIV